MHNLFGVQAVVIIAVLAVILPIVSRLASSPFTLLLISPFVIFVLALLIFLVNILLGHALDARKPSHSRYIIQAARPFAFSTPAAWEAVLTRSQWSSNASPVLPSLCPTTPQFSDALNDIITLVVRDFVVNWYQDLSSSPSFPTAVSSVLHGSLQELLNRASGIDLPVLVVKRILPKVTDHIELFRQSEMALRGAGLERRLTQSEELDLLLANRYTTKRDAKLHPAVDNLSTTFTAQTEQMHLRRLADKFLPFILTGKEGKSNAFRIAVREVVVCSVLYPIMDMLSDPDFWNRTIDQIVRDSS